MNLRSIYKYKLSISRGICAIKSVEREKEMELHTKRDP